MNVELTEPQRQTLRAALDRIIPPDEAQAGAAAAGVDLFILRQLRPDGYFPEKFEAYVYGLDALDRLSNRMYAAPFAEIGPAAQDSVLIQFEAESGAFFRLLVGHAQEGFYTSPAGYEMIGWVVTG